MKVIVCDNYDEMSKKAAEIIKDQVNSKPDSILGLATGSTPIGTYKELIKMYNNKEIDFKDVKTFNLDEYYPISHESDQSYIYFMKENLFNHINIDLANVRIPNGEAENAQKECEEYDKAIQESAGIDIQILGIGRNGHIGFNEPDKNLDAKTHLTSLTADTIDANSRFFASEDEVPKHALTMGMSTILSAKKIILLANGHSKYKAINELLSNAITTENPSTLLKVHPDVTIICDREAYTEMKLGIDLGGMSAKLAVIDDKNEIIEKTSVAIDKQVTADDIVDGIANACLELKNKYNIVSVGMGVPGSFKNGIVSMVNLPFKKYPLADVLSTKLNLPVRLNNDANCAALGEVVAGAGKGYSNMILITIGTGIGSGIIIDGKIFEGRGAAGEAGHMCVEVGGLPCPCGRNGCWEQYGSMSALIRQTKKAVEENPDSILAEVGKDGVSGRTVFYALEKNCPVAKNVYVKYISYLAEGLLSLINIFDPECILIAGGVSNQGDVLLKPILEKIAPYTNIGVAELKNDAGVIGAANLF